VGKKKRTPRSNSYDIPFEELTATRFEKSLEFELQIGLIIYVKHKYPEFAQIIKGDAFNGLQKLSPYMGSKTKAMGNIRGWPDFQIPIAKRGYIGFFLELKRLGTTIIKKNKELVADAHIREQWVLLQFLKKQHQFAEFGVGWEQCTSYTDWYMSDNTIWTLTPLKKSTK